VRPDNAGTAAATERSTANSNTSAAAGEPATTKVNLADVPTPVQNTAKKLAGTATIESITPKLKETGIAYEVAFMQNGTRKIVLVNKDGVLQTDKTE